MKRVIYACEPDFLISYLERIENASPEERAKAEELFGDTDAADSILEVDGEQATITIRGFLSKSGPTPLDRFFGFDGTSFDEIIEAAEILEDNEDIKLVTLRMDTPGGRVDNVDETFQALRNLAAVKKVVAVNEGLIASGGYWLAVAADEIQSTSPVNLSGSIGVVVVALDMTKFEDRIGIKVVTIRSENAPKKHADVSTESGRDVIQELVDSIERNFVARISEGRARAVEFVEENFGRGSVLVARDPDADKPDALSVGMIDAVIERKNTADGGTETLIITETEENSGKFDKPVSNIQKSEQEQKQQNRGDHRMLKQFIEENPTVQDEIDEIKAEGFKAGEKATVDTYGALLAECLPFIKPESTYPDNIRELACQVLQGGVRADVLKGAVIAYDGLIAKQAADDAQADTEDLPDTEAQNHDIGSNDGTIETEEDYKREIAAHRAVLGLE
jgi:ClpP class serine protease